MSFPSVFTTPFPREAGLFCRLVMVLLCVGFGMNSRAAMAGCDFGHPELLRSVAESDSTQSYARTFRVLGQWVYEGGQIKYVSWQAQGGCSGPNCSADEPPQPEGSGMSLPQTYRTQPSIAYCSLTLPPSAPRVIGMLSLKDAAALHGYPPAYEYPP